MSEETKLKKIEADRDKFRLASDGPRGDQVWRYRHDKHELTDITKPGYFDPVRDYGIAPGDEIVAKLGA